jgi:hypothetical protein
MRAMSLMVGRLGAESVSGIGSAGAIPGVMCLVCRVIANSAFSAWLYLFNRNVVGFPEYIVIDTGYQCL